VSNLYHLLASSKGKSLLCTVVLLYSWLPSQQWIYNSNNWT